MFILHHIELAQTTTDPEAAQQHKTSSAGSWSVSTALRDPGSSVEVEAGGVGRRPLSMRGSGSGAEAGVAVVVEVDVIVRPGWCYRRRAREGGRGSQQSNSGAARTSVKPRAVVFAASR